VVLRYANTAWVLSVSCLAITDSSKNPGKGGEEDSAGSVRSVEKRAVEEWEGCDEEDDEEEEG